MPAKKEGLDGLPVEEVRKRRTKALELIGQIKELFPDLVEPTEEDRKYSQGRMRTDEPDVLRTVLGAVDLNPEYFKSLADEDEGHDPCIPQWRRGALECSGRRRPPATSARAARAEDELVAAGTDLVTAARTVALEAQRPPTARSARTSPDAVVVPCRAP